MGFESSKKSVNIRVHDAFFYYFFIFFIKQVPVPPLAAVILPLCLHAHTPRAFQESRFPVRRVCAGECVEIVRNRVECYRTLFL